MDREMRRQYTVLVDFLGHILGPDYEVALHELKDDSNEIIAIANGELTGRHLGSPLSNKMLEYLTSHLYETQDYVLRFESTAITGKKMCSNSLFIKDPHGRLVGLLCINFDSSRYQELSARVMDLCSNMLTPGVQSGTRLIVEDDTDPTAEPPEKTYPTSIAGATASIVSEVDIAVINSNYAMGAGFNPVEDALALEASDSPYVNVLVCKEGNENNEAIQALAEALHSDTVKNFITENYGGAVVAVD